MADDMFVYDDETLYAAEEAVTEGLVRIEDVDWDADDRGNER